MGLSAGCGTDGNLSEEMFHLDQPGKKSQPMGGGAVRLKYICDMKIRWSVIKLIVKDAPLETREAIMWYGKTESFKQVIIYQNDYG